MTKKFRKLEFEKMSELREFNFSLRSNKLITILNQNKITLSLCMKLIFV